MGAHSGVSPVSVTSTASAISGSMPYPAVPAPRRPTSSWTVKTTYSVVGRPAELLQHLQENGAPHAVVHCLGHHACPQLFIGAVKAGDVTDAHRAVSRAGGPDVDVELLHVRHPARIVELLQADDPGDAAFELHAAAAQRQREDASHAAESHEPFLVNVRDDDPDLVHVRRQHDPFSARGPLDVDDEVSHGVHARLGAAGKLALDQLAHGLFVSGRAEALGEAPDQVFHVSFLHGHFTGQKSGGAAAGLPGRVPRCCRNRPGPGWLPASGCSGRGRRR